MRIVRCGLRRCTLGAYNSGLVFILDFGGMRIVSLFMSTGLIAYGLLDVYFIIISSFFWNIEYYEINV